MAETESEREGVRERVAQEATRLFTRYGVRSVKMDDIAEEMHISKRTIYENFRDKDELLMLCMKQLLTHHRRQRDEIISSSANVIEGIFGIIRHAAQIIQQTNPSLLREIERYHPRVLDMIRQYREEYEYRNTVAMIERGIEQGLFLDSVDADIAARLLLTQFEVISNETVFPPEKYAPIDLIQFIIVNFIRGIATEKGRTLVDGLAKELVGSTRH